MRKKYPTDLSEREWARIEKHFRVSYKIKDGSSSLHVLILPLYNIYKNLISTYKGLKYSQEDGL